jgi:hypothetical protein
LSICRFAFEASYLNATIPIWEVIGSESDDQDQLDGYSCGVIAAFKVYFHRLKGRLPKKHDFDNCDICDFRIFMASTIMVSQDAPKLPKNVANPGVRAPLELVDNAQYRMEQIETEQAILEVEKLEAAAAVLEVELYVMKLARMNDWHLLDDMLIDDSTDNFPL